MLLLVCCSEDGTYAMKKVLIQSKEQLDLVREEICVSSLFNHPNLLPLLDQGNLFCLVFMFYAPTDAISN